MTTTFPQSGPRPPVLHVEARLAPHCSVRYETMRDRVRAFLVSTTTTLTCFQMVDTMRQSEDELVRTFVEHIRIGECSGYGSILRNRSTNNIKRTGSREGRSERGARRSGIDRTDDRGTRRMRSHNTTADTTMSSSSQQPHKGDDVDPEQKTGQESTDDLRRQLWQDDEENVQSFVTRDVELSIHVYQLQRQGAVEEYGDFGSGDMDESVMMAHHWTLPCEELEGVWDSLIFEDRLEVKLLEYVYTTILFSDRNVNPHLVAWNRVVLLHGPPGTGKTSLCRGLAQTLGIRLSRRFHFTKLLEINCHSLFSKWFSESGKLVHRMFDQIWRMVDDDDTFVCVLIDEVESLAAARKAALSGNEPSDSIRVVNALLTQIDRLKRRKNVLVLTTSNITEAIDIAFIDRADIKMYIGLPPPKAIYTILCSSLNELGRAGIIHAKHPLPERKEIWNFSTYNSPENAFLMSQVMDLQRISELAQGMSGRAIRKLPFLAHANHLQVSVSTMDAFLTALFLMVQQEQECNAQLKEERS
ncbi:AAA-domain-containing protein [Linnemannia elongata AG-77]|uniref:AAA-domain-containing protein n=1 Tax=Linnemannia elongata AG-77 TaxID=1314771 RepID=A0A197JK53_9FUNG|nr:AAA-domain-containing protein [Linnemannia elongata AG-77]